MDVQHNSYQKLKAIFRNREPRLIIALFFLFWVPRIFFLLKVETNAIASHISASVISKSILLDFSFLAYSLFPVWILRALLPRWRRFGTGLEMAILLAALCSAFCEPFFINDMQARYNFIAVDYLVYTHEVLSNVWQSYPMAWVITGFSGAYATLLFFVFQYRAPTSWEIFKTEFPFARRAFRAVLCSLFAAAFYFGVTESSLLLGLDTTGQEVAKNGTFSLFAAYRENTLDFNRFYSTLPEDQVQKIEKQERESRFPGPFKVSDVRPRPFDRKPNVVVVLMESMSARFLNSYGGPKDLTPNLDRIANEGLWFSNVFATGTRTVRGIEAVMLSLPPTPGQSIVRRPGSENLYNLGTEFQSRGYDTSFIYGGRGFFDNMGPFFASNGFKVVDQSQFENDVATFSTAWGQCDEDLFHKAIREADRSSTNRKPFFQFLLTTSNHRPYRYPDGKVAIGSGAVREGAIQYSDFAIGEFLKEARGRPWFKDTLFVFVADHNASVAGGSGVIPRDYLIPMIFYSPSHLVHARITELGSQTDLGPTLFDLIGWEFKDERLFGSSLISHPSREAYIGNYQNVGRMANGALVLLKPKRQVERFLVNPDLTLSNAVSVAGSKDANDIAEAISDYELASEFYQSGSLAVKNKAEKHL